MEPEVLVLDEPTAGLDPIGRDMLFKAIKEYQNKTNAGVIIVSHSMEDLSKLCSKLVVLKHGEVKMFDTVSSVFADIEKLNDLNLDVPMITRVMFELRKKGVNISTDVFTVEDATKEILKLLNRGSSNG